MRRTNPAGWPRLTRFYGITPAELSKTPRWLLDLYTEALPDLEAEEHTLRLQAADFPWLEQRERAKVIRSLGNEEDVEAVDPRDAAALAGIGIRVVTDGA